MAGFPDRETALVYLTHPLTGYYYRRDGQVAPILCGMRDLP